MKTHTLLKRIGTSTLALAIALTAFPANAHAHAGFLNPTPIQDQTDGVGPFNLSQCFASEPLDGGTMYYWAQDPCTQQFASNDGVPYEIKVPKVVKTLENNGEVLETSEVMYSTLQYVKSGDYGNYATVEGYSTATDALNGFLDSLSTLNVNKDSSFLDQVIARGVGATNPIYFWGFRRLPSSTQKTRNEKLSAEELEELRQALAALGIDLDDELAKYEEEERQKEGMGTERDEEERKLMAPDKDTKNTINPTRVAISACDMLVRDVVNQRTLAN